MCNRPMPRRLLPTVLALLVVVASPATSRAADLATDLATARALEAREQWAPAESLASAALSRLEGNRSADSLQVAEALHLLGVAKWRSASCARTGGRTRGKG